MDHSSLKSPSTSVLGSSVIKQHADDCSQAADNLTIDGRATTSSEPSIKCENDADVGEFADKCSQPADKCSHAAGNFTFDWDVTTSSEPSIKCENDFDIGQPSDNCLQAADNYGVVIVKQDIPITDSKCMVQCDIEDTPQLKMEVSHTLCELGEPFSQPAIKSENVSDVDDRCALTEITTCEQSLRTGVRNRDMLNNLVELRGVIDVTPSSTIIQPVVEQDTTQQKTSDDFGGMVYIKLKGML